MGLATATAAAFWTICSLRLHRSFHSNGWDLGLIDQVLWNSARGHLFEYSFRDISYLGDHFQPFLLVFIPLKWLAPGPEPLLIVQALGLAIAAIPLHAAVRRIAGSLPASGLTCAYLLSLAAARTVSFDFHIDAFAPLFGFTAFWAIGSGRGPAFCAATVSILTLKEDGALLVLSLCWVAWFAFGWRKLPVLVGAATILYGAIVTVTVMPHFRGPGLNPLRERYSYLGDSPIGILFGMLAHPSLVLEHLARPEAALAVGLLLASVMALPLLVPRLLPPLIVATLLPLLSQEPQQATLEYHYMLVPAVIAIILAGVALRERSRAGSFFFRKHSAFPIVSTGLFVLPVLLYIWKSPLPPSFAADLGRFDIGSHAAVSRSFVQEIPSGATVSAQSAFVPHLSERAKIFEFPRVLDAEFVLIDQYGPIPSKDKDAGYDRCKAGLPGLGFDLVRKEDGISLWRRTRPAETLPDLPEACSGQH